MNTLQFAVFLTPRAADIGRLRENAQAAEAGFDYISVQDHPYVPDILDTFALIGALIGQTSRIRFMPNVANLPLRPPQMLAKASARPGPAFRRPVRAWPRRRARVAADRGPGRSGADSGRGRERESGSHRRAASPVATRPRRAIARCALSRDRAGPCAVAPHWHLARFPRPGNAGPARPQGRRLDHPPSRLATRPSRRRRTASTRSPGPQAGIPLAYAAPSSSSAWSPTFRTPQAAPGQDPVASRSAPLPTSGPRSAPSSRPASGSTPSTWFLSRTPPSRSASSARR